MFSANTSCKWFCTFYGKERGKGRKSQNNFCSLSGLALPQRRSLSWLSYEKTKSLSAAYRWQLVSLMALLRQSLPCSENFQTTLSFGLIFIWRFKWACEFVIMLCVNLRPFLWRDAAAVLTSYFVSHHRGKTQSFWVSWEAVRKGAGS